MLHTLVRSISTSHHISYVRQLTTTISLITTLFPFMFQFTSQFILSSLRKHLSSIAHCRHFPVNYKRLLSSFWIVLTYVSRDSTIVCKEGCPQSLTTRRQLRDLERRSLRASLPAQVWRTRHVPHNSRPRSYISSVPFRRRGHTTRNI